MLDLSLLNTIKADASLVRCCLRSWQPSGESNFRFYKFVSGLWEDQLVTAPRRHVTHVTFSDGGNGCGRECRKVYACALVSKCPVMASDLFVLTQYGMKVVATATGSSSLIDR